jgi:trk system potassium uptake protein
MPISVQRLRHVAFNLVSIATDSGFASVDFGQWPIFVPLLMLLLSCCTVCAGSTGSGIKMMRAILLTREAGRQLTTLLHPNAIRLLHINGSAISDRVIFAVLGFVFLYVTSIITLTFVLMGSGLDFITSLSAIIACINNAGPGLGQSARPAITPSSMIFRLGFAASPCCWAVLKCSRS